MKRSAIVITLFLALVASACGFGAGTAYFNVTQPAVPGSNAQVYFEVEDGETPSDLGPRLQEAGLIRNATVFTFYTKYIKQFDLKSGVNQGYDKIKLRKVKLEQKDGNVYVVV